MKKILLFLLFSAVVYAQPGDDDGSGTLNSVTYLPSTAIFPNPERGFYHQSVDMPSPESNPAFDYPFLNANDLINYRDENITVLQKTFYLNEFVNSDHVSEAYIQHMQIDFNFIRTAGLKVIVRFGYLDNDHIENQAVFDATKERIINHIHDVAQVINDNRDVIVAYQFGWIGAFGEGYYTGQGAVFGDQGSIDDTQWANRRQLLDLILSLHPNLFIQVRSIQAKQKMCPQGNNKVGFFNDAFLSDWGDSGTFLADHFDDLPSTAERDYLIGETINLPMSGETNTPSPQIPGRASCETAEIELERYNWSLLNKDYHDEIIGDSDDIYGNFEHPFVSNATSAPISYPNGCIDFFDINLGYRFELLDSSISGNNFTLNLRNVGYANVFRQRPANLILRNTVTGAIRSVEIASDIREWREPVDPITENTITVSQNLGSISPALDPGTYELLLNLPDTNTDLSTNPNYSIQFANQNVWEESTGYNKLGLTYIVPEPLTLSATTANVCSGQGVSVAITSPIGNFDSYVWNFPTEVFAMSATEFSFSPTSSKTYILTATNSIGNTATASFTITVLSGPTVTLNKYNVSLVCNSAPTLLTATVSGGDVQTAAIWIPISGLFINPEGTIPYTGGPAVSVYAKPTASSTYFATVTNSNGCSYSANVLVQIIGTWFRDGDGDGRGDINTSSCTQLAGYVSNNTDCDDTNANIYRKTLLFIDADGDGFNNGFPAVSTCYGVTIPSGYTNVYIGTDCDDTRVDVNPNHVEIPGNGIDDNCSGEIDETFGTTFVVQPQCGSILSSMWDTIFTYQISGANPASGYRFEVTDTTNGTVRTYDSNTSRFCFMNLPGQSSFATRYSIRVAPRINGFWRAYGQTCDLFTPTTRPTTSLNANECNRVLNDLWNSIYANQVSGLNVTAYQFRVRLGSTLIGTYTNTGNVFNFASLTLASGQSVQFATTYTVDVVLKYGSTWETNYGVACNVTTPPYPPLIQLKPTSCGITVNSHSTVIDSNSSGYAASYRFVLRYLDANNQTQTVTIDKPGASFSFQDFPGGAAAVLPGKVYNVTVQYFYNGFYQPEGPSCSVSTASSFTKTISPSIDVFDVISHPNPFQNTFMLDFNSSRNEVVEVKIYDMIGKLIDVWKINATELHEREFGGNYAAGIYNVIITQQENIKFLRVLKK